MDTEGAGLAAGDARKSGLTPDGGKPLPPSPCDARVAKPGGFGVVSG